MIPAEQWETEALAEWARFGPWSAKAIRAQNYRTLLLRMRFATRKSLEYGTTDRRLYAREAGAIREELARRNRVNHERAARR